MIVILILQTYRVKSIPVGSCLTKKLSASNLYILCPVYYVRSRTKVSDNEQV